MAYMDSLYSRYVGYVNRCLETGDLAKFKSHDDYTYMLEHVSPEQGGQYLELILKNTPITEDYIKSFCNANDAFGSPNTFPYAICRASPTNFRYLYHAHLALKHFKEISSEIDIVEVGGGYGGLCAAISWIQGLYGVKVRSYNIVDLSIIGKLQALYLSKLSLNFPVSFHSADSYGNTIDTKNLFLISNYCFSEISNENQKRYLVNLFPKVQHGFLAWNHIPVYNLGYQTQVVESEVPKTGAHNFYVRF
jgi:hypothetical protein